MPLQREKQRSAFVGCREKTTQSINNMEYIPYSNKKYTISETGLVFNAETKHQVKQHKGKDGRAKVFIYMYGKLRAYFIDHLVAVAYNAPGNGPFIRHINGDVEDNFIHNLMFVPFDFLTAIDEF